MNHHKPEKYFFGLVALALGIVGGAFSGAVVLNNLNVSLSANVSDALELEIVSQNPTVLYPNGGESFVLGRQYAIRWNTFSRGENTVYIINESGEKCLLGKLTTTNGISGSILTDFSGNACVTGITTRKPGEYQNVSRNYKIQVETSDKVIGKKSDESDGYFGLADINNPNATSTIVWVRGSITSPVISISATSTERVASSGAVLTVSLKADQTEGHIPFTVKLTASRGGNMSSTTAQYRFKCDANGTFSPLQSSNQYSCRYTTVGNYRPTVEVKVLNLARTTSIAISSKDALPQAPQSTTNFKACDESRKSYVSWKPVTGSTGYVVYRADGVTEPLKKIATLTRQTTEYTDNDPGLINGRTYWYKVTSMGVLYESPQQDLLPLKYVNCANPNAVQSSSQQSNQITNIGPNNQKIVVQSPNGGQSYKIGDTVNFSVRAVNMNGSNLKIGFIGKSELPDSTRIIKKITKDDEIITGSIVLSGSVIEGDYLFIACESSASGENTNVCDTSDRAIRVWKNFTQNDLDLMSIRLSDSTLVPSNMTLTARVPTNFCGGNIILTWNAVNGARLYRIGGIPDVVSNARTPNTTAMIRVSVPGAPYIFHVTAIDSSGRDIGRSNFIRVNASPICASTIAAQNASQASQKTYARFDLNKDGAVNNRDVAQITGAIESSRYSAALDLNSDNRINYVDLSIIRASFDDKIKLYDLSLNNKVDFNDITYIVTGIKSANNNKYSPYADINSDGKVTITDLKLVRDYLKEMSNFVALYDVNGSGSVNNTDLSYVRGKIQTTNTIYEPLADLDHDGVVDQKDLDLIANYYDQNRTTSRAIIPALVANVWGGAEFVLSQIKIGLGF